MVIHKQRSIDSGWIFHNKKSNKKTRYYPNLPKHKYYKLLKDQKKLFDNLLPNNFKRFSFISTNTTKNNYLKINQKSNKKSMLYIATTQQKIPTKDFFT